jgi:hypothetical protein
MMNFARCRRWVVGGLAIAGVCFAGGCQSGDATSSRSITNSLAGPTGAINQLDFLDRLEGKSVTTWDEMLAGILLAANKRVGGDYSARLGQARSFGLVGPDAPLNGDTPATPAAFARALLRARGERFDPRASTDDLVRIAQQRNLLPGSLRANDILEGSVVVGALVAVGEPTTRSASGTRTAINANRATPAPAARGTPSPTPAPAATLSPARPATSAPASAASAFDEFGDGAPVAKPSTSAGGGSTGVGGGSGPRPASGPIPPSPDGAPSVRPEPLPALPPN